MGESNDSRSPDEHPQEDAPLRSLLAPLASIEPSAGLRGRNRGRVLAALREQQSVGPLGDAIPWWRRQVSVPLPLAAVVLLCLAASAFLPWIRFDRPSSEPSEPRAAVRAEPPEERGDLDRVAVSLQGDASFFLECGS